MKLPFLALLLVALTARAALGSLPDDERRFFAECDFSLNIYRIHAAPSAYVGRKVDLNGTVGTVLNADSYNLFDQQGFNVVIDGKTSDLRPGESLQVLGVVDGPGHGVNALGGTTDFGTVRAVYTNPVPPAPVPSGP